LIGDWQESTTFPPRDRSVMLAAVCRRPHLANVLRRLRRRHDVVLEVVEHHFGANACHLTSLRQLVKNKIAERLGGCHRHENQKILGPSRDEYLQCFW
jgi:hypothetical protein